MLKIFITIAIILSVAIPCYSQTAEEKQYGELFLRYYSGTYPNVPVDKAKIDGYVYGDLATKRQYIKEFIQSVIIPMNQVQSTQLDNAKKELDAKITTLQDYVK